VIQVRSHHKIQSKQQEALNEMHAEAVMGVATPMCLPPDVLERIYAYAEKWPIDRNKLIPLANHIHEGTAGGGR
jgi:hypothetical protein